MDQNMNEDKEKKVEQEAAEAAPETEEIIAEGEPKDEATPEELKKEDVDYKTKFFYLSAEFENYRKRLEREKESLLKYGNEKVLSDLIQVIDNFDRTIEMLRPDEDTKVKNIVTGLDMVRKLFLDTLGKHGLTLVEALGKDFDPNFHEALAQEYAEGKKPNEVIKEYQKGYVLNGRLLRASKVVVASDKQ